MKFKVGDKVKVIGVTQKFDIGEIVKVIKIDERDDLIPYFCENSKGHSCWVSAYKVENVHTSKKTKNKRIKSLEKKLEEYESNQFGDYEKIKELEEHVDALKKDLQLANQQHRNFKDQYLLDYKALEEILTEQQNKIKALESVLAEKSKITKFENGKNSPITAKELAELWSEQPSTNEIIEFEGQQYRKVDRRAQPGDVVVFPKVHKFWNSGIEADKPYKTFESNVTRKLVFCDNNNNTTTVYGGMNGYDDINSVLVYELADGYNPQIPMIDETVERIKSSNQLRAEIIEKAKRFVEEHQPKHCMWLIDDEERTVKLLNLNKNGMILNFGQAKCHPKDVYNKDIGKAIAVGRLRNKDVSEFENAVQPDELAKGQTIETEHEASRIIQLDSNEVRLSSGGSYLIAKMTYKIIDDTDARYGVTE